MVFCRKGGNREPLIVFQRGATWQKQCFFYIYGPTDVYWKILIPEGSFRKQLQQFRVRHWRPDLGEGHSGTREGRETWGMSKNKLKYLRTGWIWRIQGEWIKESALRNRRLGLSTAGYVGKMNYLESCCSLETGPDILYYYCY